MPPIRGGCRSGIFSSQINETGVSSRRGLTDVRGEPDKCFRDSVLCSIFSKDLYTKIVNDEELMCRKHRLFCVCRQSAEIFFKKAQRKG